MSYAPVVEAFLLDGQRSKLSQAALETLAVIAYRQPVTRARISAIRGVNVDGVVRTLLARGLITEAGTDPDTGGGLYRTTTRSWRRWASRRWRAALAGAAAARTRHPRLPTSCDRAGDTATEGIRLQKVLAAAGVGSRRACEQLIAEGRVASTARVWPNWAAGSTRRPRWSGSTAGGSTCARTWSTWR